MKKQIILIRGWVAKENYKDFYDFLEKQEFDPYEEKTKRWNRNLWEILGEKFELIEIPMPNRHFADYKAWKIMFKKVFPYLKDEVIFVWHSLGWTFLTKYFEEEKDNNLLEKTKKIILVAPAFKDDDIEILWKFNFNQKLENLGKIQEKIIIFWSKDDFIIPFSDIEDFMKVLPKAKYRIFENKGHFLQEDFDELKEELESI